jgi:hypothetical protein
MVVLAAIAPAHKHLLPEGREAVALSVLHTEARPIGRVPAVQTTPSWHRVLALYRGSLDRNQHTTPVEVLPPTGVDPERSAIFLLPRCWGMRKTVWAAILAWASRALGRDAQTPSASAASDGYRNVDRRVSTSADGA